MAWAISFFVFRALGDWSTAGNIGDSFGAVSALFSGAALALAIYSMVLQQKQTAEFESQTLAAQQQTTEVLRLVQQSLEQQARNAALLEQGLARQAHAGRVAALTFMIERQEQRVDTLRDWGRNGYNDENHYRHGIDAAQQRIKDFESEIKRLSEMP